MKPHLYMCAGCTYFVCMQSDDSGREWSSAVGDKVETRQKSTVLVLPHTFLTEND